MQIGSIDRQATQSLRAQEMRREKEKERIEKEEARKREQEASFERSRSFLGQDFDDDFSEVETIEDLETPSRSTPSRPKNLKEYPSFVSTAQRYGVSTRAATALANALLKNLDLNTEENLLSRTKVQQMMARYGEEKASEHGNIKDLECIKFDGRIDTTVTQEERNVREDHITVISEPGAKYLDHFTPKSGKACDIADELFDLLKEYRSAETIRALGCDGTAVNTGRKGGVLRLLELKLQRPLQWVVCLLHFNELPLRHFFGYYDGKSAGPGVFKGVVGKQIENLVLKPVVDYEAVPGKVGIPDPQLRKVLSIDQQYLVDVCLAIQGGSQSFPVSLQQKHPGKSHQARWVTTANSILRLYAQEPNPSEPLRRLVGFVLNVYAPAFLKIKTDYDITDGAKNFFFCLQLARDFLTVEEQKVVGPVFSNNSYFSHPENILLAALRDTSMTNRRKAVQYILDARNRAASSTNIRAFSLPKLNFNATIYLDMVDFNQNPQNITEPPLTFRFTNEHLVRFVKDEVFPKCNVPCHSQNVERHVADTTQAAKLGSTHDKRHQRLLQTHQSRQDVPTNSSKRHFT